jgi:prolyl-tRNA synthetase
MKDLYTFDISSKDALDTYKRVQEAYMALFRELRLPVIMAEASSGDMGGDRSHEFHLPCEAGEDYVASCNSCGYAANEEVAQKEVVAHDTTGATVSSTTVEPSAWRGVSHDRKTLITVWYTDRSHSTPEQVTQEPVVNIHAIKAEATSDPMGYPIAYRTFEPRGSPTHAT